MKRILISVFILILLFVPIYLKVKAMAAPTTIVVWHAYRGEEKDAIEAVAASFNKANKDLQVSLLAVRTVPASVPVCGMALAATPALAAPHTITVECRGSIRRDSTPGNPVMTVPIP